MNLKKEKEMFEAWYEKHHNGRQISCDYVYEDNSYSIGYANAMWISWQASANRLGYKLVPVEPSEDVLLLMCAEVADCTDINEMYRAYKDMTGENTK